MANEPLKLVVPMLAAALLAWPAVASSAQPSPGPAAVDAGHLGKALKLAQVVQPRDIVVEQALAVLDEQGVQSLLEDPDLRQAEDEHPGLVKAMWAAARPIIGETLVKSLPDLWKGLAEVYARHFSSAQLDEATRFFQSSTGRKFLSEIARNADIKPMTRDVMRPGGGNIGQAAYLESLKGAYDAAAAAMSDVERKEFLRFMATPAARAAEQAGPDVTRVSLEWMNRETPEMDARIEAAMTPVIEKFLGVEPAPPSKPPSGPRTKG